MTIFVLMMFINEIINTCKHTGICSCI